MGRSMRMRLFGGKKLTFLYVPDDASVRQFMVPRVAFYALGGAVVLALGLIGFFGSRYLSVAADGREMLRLHGENAQMREVLTSFQQQITSLQGEMTASRQEEKRLRVFAGLDEPDDTVRQAGEGGPSPLLATADALSSDLRRSIEIAGKQLAQMENQARMREGSWREIDTVVAQKRELWDRTPSVEPLGYGYRTSRFGRRMDPFTGQMANHEGLDFAAPPGSPIRATAEGVVVSASYNAGYGLMVEIDHGDGLHSRYAHCMTALVKPGQHVERGQIIARVGSSGRSSGSHVHYEVLKNGIPRNPESFILSGDRSTD